MEVNDKINWKDIEKIKNQVLNIENQNYKNEKDLLDPIPKTSNLFFESNNGEFLQMCFIRNLPKQNLEKEETIILVDNPQHNQANKNLPFNHPM